MIFIISAPINGGKTTAIKKIKRYLEKKMNILSIISEKRYVKDGRDYWLYVNGIRYGKSIRVCKNIKIFQEVFESLSSFNLTEYEAVIIDEIGPVEIEKKGFFSFFSNVIKNQKLCVVSIRKGMVKKVTSFFGIKKFLVFKPSETEILIKKLCM